MKFRKYKFIFVLLLLSLPAIYSLARPGFFTMYDDMQVIRVNQMDKCVEDGQIPCRWVPDLGYGYGYPLFQYYSPFPYYFMEVFHLFGLSLISSVKIGFAASILFSGIFFFLFVSHFFKPLAALIASVFYVYIPIRAGDLYVRGAMGELWGMVSLPFVLWRFEELLQKTSRKNIVYLALAILVFLTSHNLTILMSVLLLVPWSLLRFSKQSKKSWLPKIKTLSTALVLGVLLSAFYFLPLIIERNLVHLETLTQGYFNYLAHFASLKQLFFSFNWGYGPSVLGPNDDINISVGTIHLTVALLGLVFLIINKKFKYKGEMFLLFCVFLVSSFLAHEKSTFVWKAFEPLSYLQFPWRFLTISSFCLSVLTGLSVNFLSAKTKKYVSIVFVAILFYAYLSFFQPKDWFFITDKEKLSGENYQRQITASIYDYLPKSAQKAPDNKAPDDLIVNEGKLEVLQKSRGTNWYSYHIEVKESSFVSIPTYDFPAWQVTIDQEPVQTHPYSKLGLVSFNVDEGEYIINARLAKSLPRQIGDFMSLGGFVILLFMVVKRPTKKV